MKIYLIQEIISGIADCPKIFTDEKEADKHYIKLINENYSVDFETIDDVTEYLEAGNEDSSDIDINYWNTEIKISTEKV